MKIRTILAAAAILALVSCGQGGNNAQEEYTSATAPSSEISLEVKYAPEIKIGTKVEDFTAQTAAGEDFSFKSLKGKYVILDFWASWCGDCREEIPALKELYADYAPKGVQFVSFSLDNESDAWHKCLEENGMDWLQVSNLIKWKDNPVAAQFGMGWIPTMFLIDKKGKVAGYAMTAATMRKQLEELF